MLSRSNITNIPIKLLLIGDSGVGKSSLLLRYTDDTFTNSFITTIGIDMRMKSVPVGLVDSRESDTKKNLMVSIWDTAGQERFRTITSSYYRNADGIMLVYDANNKESLNSLISWIQDVTRYTDEEIQYIVVGNKCEDLGDSKEIDEHSRELSDVLGSIESFTGRKIRHILCSSKTGYNVEKAFKTICDEIYYNKTNGEKKEVLRKVEEENNVLLEIKGKKTTCC